MGNDKSPLLKGTGGGSSVIVSYIVVALGLISVASIGFGLGTVIQGAQIQNTLKNDVLPGLINIVTEPSCDVSDKEQKRRYEAYRRRNDNNLYQLSQPIPCHTSNGDEQLYPSYFAQYSKGLPHDVNGLVISSAYDKLLKAVNSGNPKDYDAIPQGGNVDFTNPQAAYAFNLIGADSHRFNTSEAPAFNSAHRASGMVENYWMALTRDVNFADYGTSPLIAQAIADMSLLTDYRGPALSPNTIFRGKEPGCTVGPFISQFLYLYTPFGANEVPLVMKPYTPHLDFLTNYTEYLRVNNGEQPNFAQTFLSGPPRYISNGRDLGAWVHMDVLFQAYFIGTLRLLYMNAPMKQSFPYQQTELNQKGFGTFGAPWISAQVIKVADIALQAAWFQKWNVHRTLRPEEYAHKVHLHKTGVQTFPIHDDLLNSAALTEVFNAFGTYLLPQAFPEGCPTHPSYCAGHATVAGACVTVLKAIFDEDYVIPNPVVPDTVLGDQRVPYVGPPLTVGGELNKLARNIGDGRVIAGVHHARSDTDASLRLGQSVAIEFLRDLKATFSELFLGFTFTDFDGNFVSV